MIRRRFSIVVLIVALCGVATLGVAKPSKATNKALAKNHKHKNKPTGNHDLIDGDIDFDDLSPKDCATYMCVSQVASATEYMEAGCPGPFSRFEPETREDFAAEMNMGEVLLESSDFDGAAAGVSTGTLMALASASGVFAAGVGFLAGYKTSPSFAYMRIPSIV